ncbi:MAG: DUF3830 family protein [Alphaproteobacteria bacterium]|nr:DUF3830 family protein [Alphaproteobacteria bacterium]TAD88244.1 MAG: DUF3830 family protein [Alphaproteobacteria bacterium]
MARIRFREERSGLDVRAVVQADTAPDNARFLMDCAAAEVAIPSIHAMWTGPEISCPVPDDQVPAPWRDVPLPLECATLNPSAGDVIVAYLPKRVWGGNPQPVYDIGLFYLPGGRMLFPIGWHPGSLAARVLPEDLEALRQGCQAIRRSGACTITLTMG